MIALLVVFATLLAFASFRWPKTALLLLAAVLPSYGVRFTISGLPTTLLEIAIWSVFCGWGASVWVASGGPRFPRLHEAFRGANPFAPFLLPLTAFLLATVVSCAVSPAPLAALGLWRAYVIEPLMVFVMAVLVLRGTPESRLLPYALGLTVLPLALLAFIQWTTGVSLPEPWATNRPLRVTSWYSYPNAVGLFVAPIVAMHVVGWLDVLRRRQFGLVFWWCGVVVAAGTFAVVAAVSKGAIVGLLIGGVVALFATFPTRRQVLALGLLGVTVLVLFIPVARERILDEVLFRSPSGVIRLVVWEETAALLRASPLLGAGMAGYQQALIPFHEWWRPEVSPWRLEIFLYPHNVFLNAWVEFGLFGLVAFLWVIFVFARRCWQSRDELLSRMAIVAMATLLVHGLVDVPYFKNDLAVLFWLIMAMPLLVLPRGLSSATSRDSVAKER